MSLQSKGMAEEQPSVRHPATGAGFVSPVAHTSSGVPSPGTGLGQLRKQPPSSTHPFKDLDKAQRLQDHTEVHPQAHHYGRDQGSQVGTRASTNQLPQVPLAPPYTGTPCHTPSPGDGDGPTHRHSAGAL